MTWKKAEYLVACSDETGKYRKPVKGMTTIVDGYTVGVHKMDGVWIVTDVSTGYLMHVEYTQKEAKQWTEENSYVFKEIFSGEKHAKVVEEVEGWNVRS